MTDRSLSRPLGLAAALAATMLIAGCSSAKPPQTFDLSAPANPGRSSSISGTLVVVEPVTVSTLDGQRVVVKPSTGEVTFLPNTQWSDRLPKLVQAKMIEAFENSSKLRSVGRPGDRLSADFQLVSEIRAFQVDAATGSAVVEITAKVVNDKTGKIVSAQVLSARRPIGGAVDGPNATRALDEALRDVLAQLVSGRGRGAGA